MRIVVVGLPRSQGGLGVHGYELVQFLREQHHEVCHIELSFYLPHVYKILFWGSAIAQLWLFRPDLLISTATGYGYRVLAKLCSAKCFKLVQIVSDNCSAPDFVKNLQTYDAVAAQTPLLSKIVLSSPGMDLPCKVLPCFHQLHSSHLANLPIKSQQEQIRLAYFGRLVENKGLLELLQAWQNLSLPQAYRLDVWGSGPMLQMLRSKLIENKFLQQAVSIRGPYPQGCDYTHLLSSYDAVIIPSQSTEGLPLVLLEAASVGLPILTTSVGGISDFANNNQDVILVGLGVNELQFGLSKLLSLLVSGSFSRDRQRVFFQENYSLSAIENQWKPMLTNPSKFFYC
jgi:glycosyltransferase involved in cell wall biosynthesis